MLLLSILDIFLMVNTNEKVEELKFLIFMLCLVNATFNIAMIVLDIERITKEKEREKNEMFLAIITVFITILSWMGYLLTHYMELKYSFLHLD